MDVVQTYGVAEDGAVIEVSCAAPLLDEVLARWPPIGLPHDHASHGSVDVRFGIADDYVVVTGQSPLGSTPVPSVWDQLESELALFAAQRLTTLVPFHAAALVWNGRAVIVPAPSGSGKSTLAAAAAEVGAVVLSDEYALVDPSTGLVTGWGRPVRIRTGEGVVRLPIAQASPPMPPGLLAFLAFDPGSASRWSQLSRADAATRLMSHSLCAQSRPDASLDAAMAVVAHAPTIAGGRTEAATAIHDLLALVSDG